MLPVYFMPLPFIRPGNGYMGWGQKISEDAQEREMKILFPKLGRVAVPSWLRTHPRTEERIRRLFATARPLSHPEIWAWDHGAGLPIAKDLPRWRHLSGFRW